MKKLIFFSILAIVSIALFFAGKNDRTLPMRSAIVFNQPNDASSLNFGGGVADTLVVSDTVQYPIIVSHSQGLKPFIQMYWQKIGSGTATVTATFWQSNDGTTYNAIPKGKAQSAYSKTLTLSATGTTFISFANDTALFEGQYLKIRYVTSSTASVKGKMTHKIKFNQ